MSEFWIFLFVGFMAQMVDGALGMAYGVISSTVLLAFGVAPSHISATVHAAEVFTTASSATSHLIHRNVDWRLFRRLVPAGIVGAVAGTYLLTTIDGRALRPWIAGYLVIVGVVILAKAFRPFPARPVNSMLVVPLGVTGGFADAVGGGGWGPVVTSTLLGAGAKPREVIGTVNTAEFLVTLAVSLSFLLALVTGTWSDADALADHAFAVAGLIVGGVLAAPFAGYAARAVSPQPLMATVGTLVILLGLFQLRAYFG